MSDRNTELFCSDIFRFDVGLSKKRFFVHKEAVSRFSEPVEAMMTGGLKESCKKIACLEDFDEDTFARFMEFVYSGNYSACDPKEDDLSDGTEATDGEDEPIEEAVAIDSPNPPLSRIRKVWRPDKDEPTPAPLPEVQVNFLAPILFDVSNVIPIPTEPASINNLEYPCLNYSATLLSHVRLFEFAEFYLVESLRELTTRNLYTALDTFTLHPERVQDVVQLVKHIYDTSPEPRESQQSIPSLRRLVTNFAANNIHVLVTSEEFLDLVADGGFFAKDLFVSIVERL